MNADIVVGSAFPDLELPDGEGTIHRLSAGTLLRGSRPRRSRLHGAEVMVQPIQCLTNDLIPRGKGQPVRAIQDNMALVALRRSQEAVHWNL